ncbi:MAG: lipocalin-like domain-containing protein [Bacteroidaceae bacterium]|nr:lipocalin-like domain-containing protein [Bacteroidaceae bacterium]
MENSVRKRRILTVLFLAAALVSCENVFHNDSLDFMWRLDRIEFAGGTDFDGNACSARSVSGLWVSFARDLVEIQNSNDYFGTIGILTEYGDSLRLDFSMCADETGLDAELKEFGIGSRISTFCKTRLDREGMTLSGDRTTLYFTRW